MKQSNNGKSKTCRPKDWYVEEVTRRLKNRQNKARLGDLEIGIHSPWYIAGTIEAFTHYFLDECVKCAEDTKSDSVTLRHVQLVTNLEPTLREFVYKQ